MNVLIRLPNWLGDIVMSLPALRELRRIFANDRITIMARRGTADLLDGEGLADEFLDIEPASGLVSSTVRFFQYADRLLRQQFAYAILLTNSFGSAFLARAGGIKRIAGYSTDGRRFLLTEALAREPDFKQKHQTRYYLQIAAEIEKSLRGSSQVERDIEPRLTASEFSIGRAREIAFESLSQAGLKMAPGSSMLPRLLALNPGATNSRAKRWLPERFAGVADELAEREGLSPVILGTAADLEAARETASHMRTPVGLLAGKTTLSELKGLLSLVSLVISNDTGTAHVAGALQVPTVVIFGPTEDVSTRPASKLSLVVRRNVECSPCMFRDCPIDHRCMTRISVDDVYLACKGLLAGTQNRLSVLNN
jgi:heptosyltransferase-2